jgi:carboxypeptidase C (cathepsin A)
MSYFLRLSFVSLLVFICSAAFADTTPPTPPASGSCSDAQKGATVTSSHQITVGGKTLTYTVSVGFLEITVTPGLFSSAFPAATATGPAQACIFYSAYQVQPTGASQRPLTFAFNGGPGSASLWLQLGIGPRRVNLGTDGTEPVLPFQLEDNTDTPLDLTDIVFIDPVATGFSAPASGSTPDQFFGAYNDAESVATFIRTYTDTFKREDSPLYIMGESYGGIRGSLVAQILQLPLYLPLKGVIFVSPCLSSTITNFGEDDNDTPYYTYFPSYVTASWYQKTTAGKYQTMDVESAYQAAKTFAFGSYRDALAMGNDLTPDQPLFHQIAQEMSEFTGIPATEIEKRNLRLQDADYFGLALASKNEIVGRYDSRFVGRKLSNQTGANADDPSDLQLGFPYVAAINSYLRNDLGFMTDSPYVDDANVGKWPMDSDGSEFVATHNLSQAFADNPDLQVFVASGYYDLACPMGTVEFERTRLDPDSNGKDRMVVHHYASGHMVYTNPEALKLMKVDLTAFYALSTAGIPLAGK